MRTKWIEKGESMRLESKWTRMEFEVDKREFQLNGYRLFFGNPVVERKGNLYLSQSDIDHCLKPILTPQLLPKPPALEHIAIDAGHGGKDPGAQNPAIGLREKALTLDLSKRVERLLKERGFRVSQIRTSDVYIELADRSARANKLGADLFVSLHFNATGKPAVSGVETYAFTPPWQPSTSRSELVDSDKKDYAAFKHGGWSTLAAYYIQRSLRDSLKVPDRGLKRARFTVLEDLQMPGVLVEGGFVTNALEGSNIGSAAYRERIAKAVVEGILVYQRTARRVAGEGG
jgi:N-acetylmuramoyl-L-alanine amidase